MAVSPIDATRLQMSHAPAPTVTNRRLEDGAREFEGIFISQMLETAWSTVPTDGMTGGGMGEEIFRSLMIQDIGQQMARQGGIGLAPHIHAELLKMQEARKP
ncbi:MAG: rod-binding protein [Alphaproteobacteria bacterium]